MSDRTVCLKIVIVVKSHFSIKKNANDTMSPSSNLQFRSAY